MTKLKLLGATGRFGVRYGQATKKRIDAIEKIQRKKQKCMFCNGRAKRLSKGIWQCKRCGKKFAGHAYFLSEQLKAESILKKEVNKTKVLKKEKAVLEHREEKTKSKKEKVNKKQKENKE
jgi:large subunit ribosomal protein L37Ae